jgi:2-phosphoglycerate kinase
LTKDGQSATDVDETEVIRGFLTQFEVVKHGLEATIHRAVKEAHDLIVDGIHVLPWRLDLDTTRDQAIVVPVMLVVPIKKTLGKRLKRRAKEQPERSSSRYLKNINQIWQLQSYLLAEAEEYDIPLIVNDDIDEALHDLLMHISNAVARHFAADG